MKNLILLLSLVAITTAVLAPAASAWGDMPVVDTIDADGTNDTIECFDDADYDGICDNCDNENPECQAKSEKNK